MRTYEITVLVSTTEDDIDNVRNDFCVTLDEHGPDYGLVNAEVLSVRDAD